MKEKTERNVEKRKIKIKGKIKGNEREAGESKEIKCKNMSIALNGEKSFLKENTVGGGGRVLWNFNRTNCFASDSEVTKSCIISDMSQLHSYQFLL